MEFGYTEEIDLSTGKPTPVADFPPIDLPTTRTGLFDPAPELASLRTQRPLCRLRFSDDHLGWLVTSYALGRTVLGDPRFSVQPLRLAVGDSLFDEVSDEAPAGYLEALTEMMAGAVMALDPPEHTRLRRLQTGYFTVNRVGARRAAMERIVSSRLDAMERAGSPVDFVEAFARPVPSLAISGMLGVPEDEREMFEQPSAAMGDPHTSFAERAAGLQAFSDFVRSVIERKRAAPTDDLLSELIATGELTDEELVGLAMQLFSAGHDTTANMLALSTFFLLSDRSRWEDLRAEPSSIENTVEELLRYLNLVQTGAFARTALEDLVLDGTTIRAGESVWVSLAAANRDPEKFANPDRFDPSRDASGHVAFGHGRHMCLGQHLARLELQVGLLGLVERFPTLRLAVPTDSVRLHHGEHQLYGVHELPVAW